MGEIKCSACITFKKRELGEQRRRWRMTLRWRQDVVGSGSRSYRVAGLGPSDVKFRVCVCVCVFVCVCVCVCVCVRERERER